MSGRDDVAAAIANRDVKFCSSVIAIEGTMLSSVLFP